MKEQIIKRGLFGLPVGIAIGFVIPLLISAAVGDGNYYPVTPQLIETMGNELHAVMVQTVLCGLMGAGFAMVSVIWELDSWSLAKQSGVYFFLTCLLMLPIAYVANWMEHSIRGVLIYVLIFVMIFLSVWVTQYLIWKRKINKMNHLVRKEEKE